MVTELKEQNNVTSAQHVRWDDQPIESLNSLLDRQYVSGNKTMIARLSLKAGCVVPEHTHDNEQVSYIESGALQFVVEGREIVVRAGEALLLPSNVRHSATALEDTIGIDFFAPPRQDWLEKRDSYLR